MKPINLFAKILVAILVVLTCAAQNKPPVDELLHNLDSDEQAAGAATELAGYGSDPRTVPALRAKFLTTHVKKIKELIAFTMLKLKVEDPAYFDYLASLGWAAVNSDAPNIYVLKNRRPEKLNPDFEEWCKLHGKDFRGELQLQSSDFLTDMGLLVKAHDERAAPIFRRGLLSNNPYVLLYSVMGLADLGHSSDIEPIIEVADRSKDDIDNGVVEALARFRNPHDREAIANRLRGGRLYEAYMTAVKADDERRSAEKKRTN
jgi:hypothetical protein